MQTPKQKCRFRTADLIRLVRFFQEVLFRLLGGPMQQASLCRAQSRFAWAFALLLLLSQAYAQSGLTLGLQVPWSPTGTGLNVNASYPVTGFTLTGSEFQLSARADVAVPLPPAGVPSVGIAGVVSATRENRTESYLGAGFGTGFVLGAVQPTAYLLAGWRLPVVEQLFTVVEFQLATSRIHTGASVSIGVAYTFGGY